MLFFPYPYLIISPISTLLTAILRYICMRIIIWLFEQYIGIGIKPLEPLEIYFLHGKCKKIIGRNSSNGVRLIIYKPISFCLSLLRNFKMGLTESYMEGTWNAYPSPKAFISLLIRAKRRLHKEQVGNMNTKRFALTVLPAKMFQLFQKFKQYSGPSRNITRINVVERSLSNVKAHYDLGNALFEQFLDPSLTYSCALFGDVQNVSQQFWGKVSSEKLQIPMTIAESSSLLYEAQMRKYDAILEQLGGNKNEELWEGRHILEIGCGWGAFAIRAVQTRGCRWTGLTLSVEQIKLARQKIISQGIADRVELKLLDYRHERGLFDHIVAVEMIEAVGHDHLPLFFDICSERLKTGGKICIQAILCRDQNYERYRCSDDFIRKHIFPGGHLPSLGVICATLPPELRILKVRWMDDHYALTLDIWRKSWLENREKILCLNPNKEFYRKWDMYFSLCSSLFENHSIHVAQILIEKVDSQNRFVKAKEHLENNELKTLARLEERHDI